MQGVPFKNALSPGSKPLRFPWLGYHVHPEICTLGDSHLLALLRFKGVPHDTRDQRTLNKEFVHQDNCFRAIGKQEGSNLKVQTYSFKTQIYLDQEYRLELPVLQSLVDCYTEPMRDGSYRQVGYAMALILKYRDLDDGIKRMGELVSICKETLGDFGVTVMGMEERNGRLYSQTGRFYSFLLNGIEQDVPITDTCLGDAIINSETSFGAYDYVENRPYNGKRRFATTYDLRDYPEESSPGMWDEVLEEQCDFCLVQTFHFEDRNRIKRRLNNQMSDLASTEGESDQTDELKLSVQEVAQGKKVFGEYLASLIVFGGTPGEAEDKGSRMQALMLSKNAGFVRSTSTNYVSWLTLFPGYDDVIYSMPKSTSNLACGFSLHATPTGKAQGNPPGDGSALMPMMTDKGGLFFMNAHDSPPGQNNTGEALPGHKSNIAMTGAGKTTVEALELVFFSRWNPMLFCLDYNHSLENVLRAINTQYFSIVPGQFTGIQPFQWPDSEEVRQCLFDTVKICAGGADDDEEKVIQRAINSVMNHKDVSSRSFSLMIQGIVDTGPGGLRSRLSKWCRSVDGKRGQYAWVLDSPVNLVDPAEYRRLAFDCSKILTMEFARTHPEAMEVLLKTFFFMKSRMHASEPGCLLINMLAEFWAPLMFDSTANAIMEILQAGRTRGEMLMMDTQVPEYILNNPRGPSVVQQTITQEWMANDNANLESYGKFGIASREFEKITGFTKYSRKIMVKQGTGAVVVKLDLSGKLKYWMPMLSSSDINLAVAARIRHELGSDAPAVWLAPFLDEMLSLRVKQDLKTQNPTLNVDDPAVWVPAFVETMNAYGLPISMKLPSIED